MAQQKKQYNREVAFRVFAEEIKNTTLILEKDETEQYAPQYVMTPTGAKVNRLMVVGTLTSIEDIGNDAEYWRARVSDPTGAHSLYAGEFQPGASRAMSTAEIPMILGVIGKIAVYLPEGEDASPVLSIRPESVVALDEVARERWIVATAQQTLNRIKTLEE